MTRKHFIAVARAISEARDITDPDNMGAQVALDAVSVKLATEFAGLNDNFDRDKFLAACGYGGTYSVVVVGGSK